MNVTISLLEGPTKALVSSVITATGIGGVLLAVGPSTSLCFTFRQAYDDDVFKGISGQDNEDVKSSTDLVAVPSLYSKRLRPIGREAFDKLTGTRNIAMTLSRNVALSSLIVINKYLNALYEAEEVATASGEEPEYPPLPHKEMEASIIHGSFNAVLDWTTQMIRSVLDWIATANLDFKLSRRLRKDLRASAMRKDHHPFFMRAPRVIRTSLFSEATLYIADWIVACCMEVYMAVKVHKVMSSKDSKDRWGTLRRRLSLLGLRCSMQAGRCTALWIAVSCGNGIGAAVPKSYRGFAMFLCAQIAGMGVNLFANAFIARVTANMINNGDTNGGDDDKKGGNGVTVTASQIPTPAAAATGGPSRISEPSSSTSSHPLPGQDSDTTDRQIIEDTDTGNAITSHVDAPVLVRHNQQPTQQRRVVGGPRLPQRRPGHASRNPRLAEVPVAGPDTPQAATPARRDEANHHNRIIDDNNNNENNGDDETGEFGGVEGEIQQLVLQPTTPPTVDAL